MHYSDVADGLDDGDSAATEGAKTVDIAGVTHTASSIVSGSDLDNLSMTSERDVCKLCQNHCKLTITTFQDGSRYVTGNRCERGGDSKKQRSDRPNLYDYKYKRCFAYRRLTDKKAPAAKSAFHACSTCTRTTRSGSRCSPRSASR